MRVVAFLIASVVTIVVLGIWSLQSITASAQELAQQFDRLEQNISQKNWHDSSQNLAEISQLWSKTKNRWILYLNHQEIDNIDLAYARLRKFVEAKDLPSALAEVAALKLLVEHIPELSAFTLENIL